MNRREFLATGAASLAIAADRPVQKLSFGFSLYGMKSLKLDEALRTCATIGYASVELALMPGYHADPASLNADQRKHLRQALADQSLTVAALMENLPLDADAKWLEARLDRLKKACELARDLGGDAPPVIETVLGGKPEKWDDLKGLFADRLAAWARIAGDAGVAVCVKPHRFGAMNLPDRALWLLKQVEHPRIKLAFDWSHFERTDWEMAKAARALAPVSKFVHIKDTVFTDGKPTFVLPGDGETDYSQLLPLLADAGYRGAVCVEVSAMVSSQKDYDPIAAAKKCFAKLAPSFAKVNKR
jgi:inosose dehydratase